MIRIRQSASLNTLIGGDYWARSGSENVDSYRDTPSQKLQGIIAQIQTGVQWRNAVAENYRLSEPWLHRIITDPCRDLFFRQYPINGGATVLDIGAGWGQMCLPLARDHNVVALEPTPERLAFIRAVARQEGLDQRMVYVQSDFMDVEFEPTFDLVCCIGVLEWVPKFRPGVARDLQRAFLARIRSVLKPGGKVVVGIENRLGLKYLLGSSDDHIGSPNIAVLDAALANRRFVAATGTELRSYTYSLAEYLALFSEAGFSQVVSYAAFPDYKVPELILKADEFLENQLAKEVVLPEEHDGCNGEKLSTSFQEMLRSHYRSLAMNKICRFFAPSYFLEASI